MTLLEYTVSLQDQNLSEKEIFDKVQIWKKNNPQPEVEEVEEEVVVEEESTPEATDIEEEVIEEEEIEFVEGAAKFNEDGLYNIESFLPGKGRDMAVALNKQKTDAIQREKDIKAYEEFTKVAKPKEVITKDGKDYRYIADDEGIITYQYKPEGEDVDWKSYDTQSKENIKIASQFGHADWDYEYEQAVIDAISKGQRAVISADGTIKHTGKDETFITTLNEEELVYVEELDKSLSLNKEDNDNIKNDVNAFMDTKTIRELKPTSDESGYDDYQALLETGVKVTAEMKAAALETGRDIPNPAYQDLEKKAKEVLAVELGKDLDFEDPKTAALLVDKMRTIKTQEIGDKYEEDKIEEWIEDQDTDTDWSQIGKILGSYASPVLAGMVKELDATTVWDRSEAQKLLAQYKKDKKTQLTAKQNNVINWYDKAKNSIVGINTAITALSKADYQSADEAAEANALIKQLQAKAQTIYNLQEKKGDKLDDILLESKDVSEDLNLLERNYNNLPIFINNFKNSTLEMGMAIEEVAYRVADLPNAFGLNDDSKLGMAFSVLSGPIGLASNLVANSTYKESRKNIVTMLDEYKEGLMNGIAPPKSIGELNDGDDWGRYFSTLLGSQVTNTVVLFATGGAALPLLSTSAAGSSFREMQGEMDQSQEAYDAWEKNGSIGDPPAVVDYNPLQMYTVAIGNGALEYVTESVSLGIVSRAMKASGTSTAIKRGFLGNLKYTLTTGAGARNALRSTALYGYDVAKESSAEGVVELGGNLFDRFVLKKEGVDLLAGVPDAMFSGGFMAGGIYKAPHLFSGISQMVQGPDSSQKIAENRQQILNMQETIMANPNMSIQSRRILENEIGILVKKSSNEINKTLNRFSVMERSDIDALSDIELSMFENRKNGEIIQNDPGIDEKTKKIQLEALSQAQENLLGEKNRILEPFIKADADINPLTNVELTGRQVEAGAKAIADQLDVGVETFENEADVQGALKTLKEQGGKVDEKNSTSYGTIVTMEDGSQQVIINNEAAKQDRVITTPQHEVLHAVLKQKLAGNPELANKLGTELLNELQNNPDIEISQEVLDRIEQYKDDPNQAEEIITIVSEALTNSTLDTPTKGMGTINIKKPGVMKRIGDFFTNLFNKEGVNVKFETGKDVLDFVINYNKAVMKGEGLTPELMEVAGVGTEVDTNQQAEQDLDAVDQRIDTSQITADQTFEEFRTQQVKENQVDSSILDENRNQAEAAFNTIRDSKKSKESKTVASTKLSDKGQQYVDAINEGLMDNTALVSIINSPSSTPTEIAGAIDALIETNFGLISQKLGYQQRPGGIEIQAIKESIQEQILGIFPGRKGKLLSNFDITKGEVSTRLGDLVGKRQAEILERASELSSVVKDKPGLETVGEVLTETEGEDTKVIATKKINPFSIAPKAIETQTIEAVARLAKEKGIDNLADLSYKELKSITPYEILAAEVGIETSRITNKKDNLRKPDMTKAQMYVNKNADVIRQTALPKGNVEILEVLTEKGRTKKIGGETTSVPKAIIDVFYNPVLDANGKHKKVNNNFQYKLKPNVGRASFLSAFGIDSKGNIKDARSTEATRLKGLLELIARSRTSTAATRIETKKAKEGKVEPSEAAKRQADLRRGKARALESKRIKQAALTNKKIDQKAFDIQQAEKAVKKPWVEMSNVEKATMFNKVALKLKEYGLAKLLTSTNLTQRADYKKAGSEQIFITAKNLILKNKDIPKKRKAEIIAAIKAGEIMDLTALKTELGDVKNLSADIKASISVVKPLLKLGGKDGIIARTKNNLENLNKREKGGKEIRKALQDILKKNPELLPAINYLLYQVNNSTSFARMMAPLVGYINQKGYKQSQTVGEHALQYGEFVNLLTSQALVLNNTEFDYFNNWLADNYVQVQVGSGTKASWSGSGIKIQDVNYTLNYPNLFAGGTVNVAWNGTSQMHPALKTIIEQVNKGELTWKEVSEQYPNISLVKYFSEYGYYNPNTFMYKGKTAADQFGAKVDSIYTKVDPKTGVPFFPNVVKVQAYAINKVLTNQWTNAQAQSYVNLTVPIAVMESNANATIAEIAGDIIPTAKESKRVPRTTTQVKKVLENSNTAKVNAQKINKKTKGISMFDMDDTLALTKEKVKYTMPDGKKGELTAAEFSQQAETLQEQGVKFDFSAFENVDLSTPKGPLAGVALKRQAKYGSKDIYVVTARPGASQQSIKLFLDSIGLNIPLGNIVTLEDGTPQAKADFVLQKAAEGYNDFYFADDSALNVDTVKKILDQIDVKSKTQIAIADKAKRLDVEFNEQIEDVTGKESFKEYSDSRARLEGKKKDGGIVNRLGKQLTITYSAEDFMGLMYGIIGKGKKGDKQARWIKENIMDPYNNAEQAVLSAQVTVANDFAALKKQFPTLRSKMGNNPLMSQIGVGPYTKSQGIRVYLWDKQGMEIPGMSKRDQAALVKAVKADTELQTFANEVALIQKTKKYPAPSSTWLAGDITTDVLKGIDTTFRTEQMTEFNENVDVIFSNKNLNKLEAIYGSKYREALEDSIRRMKSGSNRPIYTGGGSRIVNEMLDWLNSSVGVVMFLNMRSGLLQLISNVNFVNWGDNNMYAAAKAFASKDYFPTVMKLMNSDYLVNRRDGLKINVNEAELADAGRKGGFKGMLNYLLDKGFIITRIMDSLAIATGGATFYINRLKAIKTRINPETGKLYTETEAETKAFKDFYEIAEETQQSSNPSRISQQQASLAGRIILSFQNVTMQYTRKTKKSIKDLYNRRKKPGMTQRESDLSNISSIIYYVGVQNLLFHSLQQALFALAFDDEEDEKSKNKAASIANGMVDSLLFGLGFGGAAISTVKNVLMKLATEKEKKSPAYQDVVWDVFDISPVIDSKIRKLRSAAKTFSWNMKEIKERGWSIDNPAYLAVSQIISALTNAPLDRVLRKTMNLRQAMDEETRVWQKVALVLGWDGWGLGLPYWGLPSTIKKEAEDQLRIEKQYKNDVRKLKRDGYEKAKSKKYVTGKLNVNYIQVESPTGIIEYWRMPKNKKK